MDYNGNVGLDRCIRGLKFNFFCVDNGGFVGLVRCIRGLKFIFFFLWIMEVFYLFFSMRIEKIIGKLIRFYG
jgi:hypothetical protein